MISVLKKKRLEFQIFQNKLDGILYWEEGLSSDSGLRIGMSHAKDKKLWISKIFNDIVWLAVGGGRSGKFYEVWIGYRITGMF